jgi:hypothetical protein
LQDYSQKWYHFGLKPKHAERFPFSSTLLVWLTEVAEAKGSDEKKD